MGKGRCPLAGAVVVFGLLLALPAPALAASVDKSSLDFGGQRVGTASGPQTVRVTVGGLLSASSSINGYTLTGAAPGDYSVTPGPMETFSFGVGATGNQDYTVTFTPTAGGARTATLTFSTTENPTPGPGSPTVMLTGTGTVPQPAVTLDPASPSLAFGDQEIGTTSGPRSFRLTNSGNGPLTVSSISLGGADAADFVLGYCVATPFTLQPGQSCSIGAVFKPTVSGQKAAQITIAHDAAGSPRTIPISGAGFAPPAVAITAPAAKQKLRRYRKVRKRGKLVRRKVALTFRGSASDPAGLARVELALVNVKLAGGKCTFFDGKRETKTDACGATESFKATLDEKTWSYVLPAKATIATGEYVLVAKAVSSKGVATRKPAFVRFRLVSR